MKAINPERFNPARLKKQNNSEKEQEVLYDCLFCCQRDGLIQKYWKLVFDVVKSVLSGSYSVPDFTLQDIEDFHHDALIDLLENDNRKLWKYDEKKKVPLAAWIKLIANRFVKGKLRSKKYESLSKRRHQISIIDDIWKHPETRQGSERDILKKEVSTILKNRLTQRNRKKLKIRDQLILELFYYQGLSREEAASCLNMTVGAFDTAKSRAIDRIQKIIAEDGDLKKV
ncbi:sigma-70 family RNA polymerase sigma factor [Desulfobacterales bacterium HSG16]|nr:sigma-70 family RNA polymerase sigma factor [Desulfobacterales bacterium HSG16]